MNLPIKLLRGIGIADVKGEIPITDDPFIISTTYAFGNLDNVFVTAQNGNKTVIFELSDGVAVLPEALKTPGVLRLLFQKIVDGVTLHTWQIEPILLKDISGEFTAIPQITALEKQVEALTEAVAELKKIIIENGEF